MVAHTLQECRLTGPAYSPYPPPTPTSSAGSPLLHEIREALAEIFPEKKKTLLEANAPRGLCLTFKRAMLPQDAVAIKGAVPEAVSVYALENSILIGISDIAVIAAIEERLKGLKDGADDVQIARYDQMPTQVLSMQQLQGQLSGTVPTPSIVPSVATSAPPSHVVVPPPMSGATSSAPMQVDPPMPVLEGRVKHVEGAVEKVQASVTSLRDEVRTDIHQIRGDITSLGSRIGNVAGEVVAQLREAAEFTSANPAATHVDTTPPPELKWLPRSKAMGDPQEATSFPIDAWAVRNLPGNKPQTIKVMLLGRRVDVYDCLLYKGDPLAVDPNSGTTIPVSRVMSQQDAGNLAMR